MEGKKPRCHNCIHASESFKVSDLTHHHCQHPKYTKEQFESGELTAWDTLVVFNETCGDHEFKT